MQPVNRLVLLGASNLTFSLRMIIQLLQQQYGAPSEVLVAAGHGRSYGQNSLVLVRELPGIVQCGLWRQLYASRSVPTYAFLTDIGNDIPYGYLPSQILRWVSWCIQQLQQSGAHIVMTNLPIDSIKAISERRFKVLRSVLFPTCRLSRDEIFERAYTVHQGLNELAARHLVVLYEPEPKWMGFDGIHVSLWKRQAFYRQLFCYCANSEELGSSHVRAASVIDRCVDNQSYFSWRQRPRFAVRRLFGKIHYAAQPSGCLADSTTVALY
ncbi:hypothetical protein [Nitrosomonas sp.]|uniref:hypothetical protein n=1 Tax=Nitrosomonas sp. TaxID=42353 RepID=UPI00284915A4|nr:hypothetical protein [Nitrosomonas sp.]MDR4513461.1 hypothetical protein [Nitrosomonas sp.]